MDNASVHTSEEFEECLPRWKKKGLTIKYLSTYSPELNLIEILWRNIKYTWLPFSAYQCLNALCRLSGIYVTNDRGSCIWGSSKHHCATNSLCDCERYVPKCCNAS